MSYIEQKNKFFEVLKDIFIGAKIEGKSGYVNLMKIKSKFYEDFKLQLERDINKKLSDFDVNFREELYNKLYTFFKKYFSESGSIYFSYTPIQEKVYEKIYRDDKDVMLFWKTNMLYYVKSERLFKDLDIDDPDTKTKYSFDVSKLELKKNNEKKELVFEIKDFQTNSREDCSISFWVNYSKNGSKTKTEDILKALYKHYQYQHITLKNIERIFSIFKRQSEVDYFINKNAKEFLREQFTFWLKSYLIDDETIFDEMRLKQMKALKSIAFDIIDLVSQFEDELVKIWNKPKFAHSSNYVITLDKIAELNFDLLNNILQHSNIEEQIEEWKLLGIADNDFNINNNFDDTLEGKSLSKKWKFLPIDTKYFKDLELDILALFDNLDEQLDGWLIHSENYQALNTIKGKFRGKVQTTYIDPPFNLESSDQFDYRTNYKDSSWLTLLENRLQINKYLLNEKGSFFGRCDVNGNYYFRFLLQQVFQAENFSNELILRKANSQGTLNTFNPANESLFLLSKDINKRIFYPLTKKRNREVRWVNCLSPKENKSHNTIIVFGEKYKAPKGNHWRFSQAKMDKLIEENRIRISERGIPQYLESEEIALDTNWTDIQGYSFSQGFSTENAESLLKRVIESTSDENDLILDYFMGSGTTQAVAQKLKRRWIGVEMGEHFHTVDLRRMKRVVAGIKEGISKDLKDYEGGGFFKYYSLEQYEETLSRVKYEDKAPVPNQNIYHQYIFLKDLKLTEEVLNIDEQTESIKVDLTKLHKDIDIPETLSHLLGKFIKQIKKDELIFTDGTIIDLQNIDYRIIKPLIWW